MDNFSEMPMIATSVYLLIGFVNNIFNEFQILLDKNGGF